MTTVHKVISSCRSARNICGGIEYNDNSDIVARSNEDNYFRDGNRNEVRKVDNHIDFSRMTSSCGKTDRKV